MVCINNLGSNVLAQIRDIFLPKPLSGEIRVNIEEELEEKEKQLDKANKAKENAWRAKKQINYRFNNLYNHHLIFIFFVEKHSYLVRRAGKNIHHPC
ncbi:MAG: hypothetical protein ACOC5L_04495 [Halobacteriota archaeon]